MKKIFLILIPLILSGFIHLLNPVGFPDVFFDEGVYMRRAMHLIETGDPQEGYLYDHPYFGQIILGGVLQLTNYPPDEVSTDPKFLQNLYLIPRVFMGLLAMLDTFLIYLITKEKFESHVALLSSTLFAVMPFTWIFNRILLDSILLPFLLSSILVAVYFSKPEGRIWLAPLSGILFGVAIFTKLPAFVFIPLIIWIIFQKRRNYKDLLVWIIPALLIPLLWPAHSISLDQFDLWIKDLIWQTQRSNSVIDLIKHFLLIDPVLFAIGVTGIIYCAITKNKFVLLWFVPFMLFLSVIGFKQYFHWIPLIPIFCIAASIWLLNIPKHVKVLKSKTIHLIIISIVIVFGFSSTLLVISNDLSSNQFQMLSYVLENHDTSSTILASPVYSWILSDVFLFENIPKDYSQILFEPPTTKKIIVIADPHFMLDLSRGFELQNAYNSTHSIQYFEGNLNNFDTRIYPYSNMMMTLEEGPIDIREGSWQ